jgi:sugar fermentation stimulation protein A
MIVKKEDAVIVCHCPSTGKIGRVIFDSVPCLLSSSPDVKRKTTHTVEAISVNGAKSWIGINQNAANRYIEHFFRIGALSGVVSNGHILREQRIGGSKLDFRMGNIYVEVKMPLQFLALSESDLPSGMECVNSAERFVRHVAELEQCCRKNENSALMLLCFVYDAPIFTPPVRTVQNKIIGDAVRQSLNAGVKIWQVNMSIDSSGVKLLKYFDITDHLISGMNFSPK